MLLTSYRKEVFRPECNPKFQSLHCIAHLDQDVGEVIPYLNAVLGGSQFTREPPSVTFKAHGKLITVHPRQIAINALKEPEEADRILEWLKEEINNVWEKRAEITPKYEPLRKPQVFTILKRLPKTNCKDCGYPTCTVFAVQVAEGGRDPEDCPHLSPDDRQALNAYLEPFDRNG
ncbi:MAG: Fe-S cluster domain protein [Desulfacinum sp.]|jgi:ArsR family metal-binding transcriptional regulator|nr:Fe-S cluster domain protein [Desulfacinum sp.]